MTLEGILPIWKPKGFTSHDVVAKVRRILKIKRIGHTGTLDPQVTGVLPLCIGRATRLVEYIQDLPKTYEARVQFGFSTDTEDLSGQVTERMNNIRELLSLEQVEQALHHFVGEIEQVPPMYSAVKVDGKRLYELARQGVEVERKPRNVTIYSIDLLESNWEQEYPEIHFRVTCSKGTYIRTLCVDIGKRLGVPSVMSELVRTCTGNIGRDQCLTLEQVDELNSQGQLAARLIPMEQAVNHLPSVQFNSVQTQRAIQGQQIGFDLQIPGWEQTNEEPGMIAAFSEDRRLVGIFEWNSVSSALIPVKIFA